MSNFQTEFQPFGALFFQIQILPSFSSHTFSNIDKMELQQHNQSDSLSWDSVVKHDHMWFHVFAFTQSNLIPPYAKLGQIIFSLRMMSYIELQETHTSLLGVQ